MTRHFKLPVLLFVVVCQLNDWCCRALGDTVPGTSEATMGKKVYKTAFCLTHIETNEIYLRCGEHNLVNLLGAYHGVQDIAMDDNPVCSYVESDECLRPIMEVGPLRTECMGQEECRFPVYIIYLENCKQDSNFVQVEYECIPGNAADFGNNLDICGDVLQGKVIEREQGYIQSLDYPHNYPPDSMCTCNLTALDEDAEIIFSTLDVDTFSALYYQRGEDWLEYTTDISQWGNGHVIDKEVHGSDIHTGSNAINLNFRSDAINEARGFWLKYKALRTNGEPSNIKLSCGKYYPNNYRSSIACLEPMQPKNEVYLNCHYMGVINVLYAEHGYNENIGPKSCKPIYQRTCTQNAIDHFKLLEKCMGQRECNIVISKETIPSCSQDSNYFQVEYQCIPDLNDPKHIVDVCGDVQEGKAVFNDVGYIESLNYPQPYSPDNECECKLEVSDPNAEIILTVLDVKMAPDEYGNRCTNDYVEYNRDVQDRGNGVKMCDGNQVNKEPIHTAAKIVYLNTKSDSDNEDRGFWLKYYGRKPDGTKSQVNVTCSKRRPSYVEDTSVEKEPLQPTNPPNSKTTTRLLDVIGDREVSIIEMTDDKSVFKGEDNITFGVMVGLGVVAVLIFGVLIGMIVFKYKRKNGFRKQNNSNSVLRVSENHHPDNNTTSKLESGYGSTFHNSYNTLHNESPNSTLRGGASSISTGYSASTRSLHNSDNSVTTKSCVSGGVNGGGAVSNSEVIGIHNAGFEPYIPEPDYGHSNFSSKNINREKDDYNNKRKNMNVNGKYLTNYKNPLYGLSESDGNYDQNLYRM